MVSRSIADTNPYLRDPKERKRQVLLTVATSSAIEGIRAPFRKPEVTAAKPRKKAAKKPRPSRGKRG